MRAAILTSIVLGLAWSLLASALMGGGASPSWLLAGAAAGAVAGRFTLRSRASMGGEERALPVLATYYLGILVHWAAFVVVERVVLCVRRGGWTGFDLRDHLSLIWIFLAYGTLLYGVVLIPLCALCRQAVWKVYTWSAARGLLLLLFFPALLAAGEAVHVPAREAAAAAERLIAGARTSVRLYLYLFSLPPAPADGAPARLADALVQARARGVDVEVTLDAGAEAYDSPLKNRAAADRLAAGGIQVFLSRGAPLHAKALVVDGHRALVGSSNWSAAAFGRNGEANVLVEGRAAAALEAELSALPRTPHAPAAGGVRVPRDFLFRKDGLGAMARRDDVRALDAYLAFLRDAPPGGGFRTVDARALARALRLPGPTETDDRRQIARALRRLKTRYRLIDFELPFGGDPRVRLLPAGAEGPLLPEAYFAHGWDARLGLAAKSFLLLALHYGQTSPAAPRWALSGATLARAHHVSPWFIRRGSAELRRADLLEVEHSPFREDAPRKPNAYALNALYDPAPRAAKRRALEAAHGAPALARAQALAALVYEDADVEGVEALILLEQRHGVPAMQEAARVLGAKSPDNPKRALGYLLGTIKSLAAGPSAAVE